MIRKSPASSDEGVLDERPGIRWKEKSIVVECWDSTERRSTQPSAMLLLHTNERGNSVQTQSALYLRVRHFEPVCKRNYCLDKPPLVLDPTPRFERWRRSLKLCDAIPVSVCASDWDFADGGKPPYLSETSSKVIITSYFRENY